MCVHKVNCRSFELKCLPSEINVMCRVCVFCVCVQVSWSSSVWLWDWSASGGISGNSDCRDRSPEAEVSAQTGLRRTRRRFLSDRAWKVKTLKYHLNLVYSVPPQLHFCLDMSKLDSPVCFMRHNKVFC